MSEETNIEEFSTIAALILQRAFSNFPMPADIDFNAVAQSIGLNDVSGTFESGRTFLSVAGYTLKWLIDNGYVDAAGVFPRDRVSVTDKGFAALRTKSTGGLSFGKQIEEVSITANTNEGRRQFVELIGSFLGSAVSSAAKGLAGS